LVSDEGDKDWKYNWVIGSKYNHQLLKDGDEFSVGNIKLKTVYSPGHTPEHISLLVTDGATTDEPMGLLSGDFIFVGDVGRPDLLETAAGEVGAMDKSAKVLYKSIEKFKSMPEYLQLWPGHGAGSACGKALGAVPESTVGYEQRFNGSIKAAITEKDFVDFILDGQPEPPLYFARMKRDNKNGPKILGEIPSPERMSIQSMIGATRTSNAVIVDARNDRMEFMNGHIQGSLYAPFNKTFNTIAGSYINDDEEMFLIIEEDKVDEAVLDLIRIGLDNIKGFATPADLEKFGKNGSLFATETIGFDKVDELMPTGDYNLLDVRKSSEFEEGHHPKAMNIAHTRLEDRKDEIPNDKPVLVHCKTGARAAAASAMLEKEGFVVKYINDEVEPWLAGKASKNDLIKN
jgi:hydroxyacylglutathione hydrolase